MKGLLIGLLAGTVVLAAFFAGHSWQTHQQVQHEAQVFTGRLHEALSEYGRSHGSYPNDWPEISDMLQSRNLDSVVVLEEDIDGRSHWCFSVRPGVLVWYEKTGPKQAQISQHGWRRFGIPWESFHHH